MHFPFLQPIGPAVQLTPHQGRSQPGPGPPGGLAAANQLLAPSLRIHQLIRLPEPQPASPAPLQLSWWTHGELSITRLQGPALTLQLEPLQPLCTLLLAADGQISTGLEPNQLTCQAGQSLTYLPARRWQQTNHCGMSLGLHCAEEALRTRLLALAHRQTALCVLGQLGQPIALALTEPHRAAAYQQLLLALQLLEQTLLTTGQMPHPFLRLDDLILRAVALLLCPEPNSTHQPDTATRPPRTLQQSVNELMGWMLANLHQPIALADIERRCAYGRRAIQLGFKRQVGCGPLQWLRRQRLEAAYHQLQGAPSNLTVSAVARRCGYLSLSSFSRDFLALFERTPSSLLRQARQAAAQQHREAPPRR